MKTWQDFFGENTQAFQDFLEVATFYKLKEKKRGCFYALLEFLRSKILRKEQFDTQNIIIPTRLFEEMAKRWNDLSPEEQQRRIQELRSDQTVNDAVNDLVKQIRDRRNTMGNQSNDAPDDTRFT